MRAGTSNPVDEALVVFARNPRLGEVKTRLCPPLTREQAMSLHRALVEDTLERLSKLRRPDLQYLLYLSDAAGSRVELTIPPTWSVHAQAGNDLGARLANALHGLFRESPSQRAVVLGADSPTVPLQSIHDAFDALGSVDVVLGPALDGGYYLLGCSRFVPEMFQGIDWGTEVVLEETQQALEEAGASFALINPWYDVDTESDLVRLKEEIGFLERQSPQELPHRTARLLEEETLRKTLKHFP